MEVSDMWQETVRNMVKEGAKEVVVRTAAANLHFMRVGNAIVQIDKSTGVVLTEFPIY